MKKIKQMLTGLFPFFILPYCMAQPNWGDAVRGLQVGVIAENTFISVSVKNTSSQPFKICRNINSNDLDFYHVEVRSNNQLVQDMYVGNQLQPNTQKYEFLLLPNDSYSQSFRLDEWFDKNGNTRLAPGVYSIIIYFEMEDCYTSASDHWNGTAKSGITWIQVN